MDKINEKSKKNTAISSGFISGAFSLTLSAVIVKIIGLVYKIPLACMLGDEGMGYFNSAYTVFAFFYLLCTAGVPKAVMILISEAKARNLVREEQKIVKVASIAFFIIGAFFTDVLIIFAIPISNIIGSKGAFASMIAIAPSILLVSLSGVIRGYLSANMRLMDIAVSQIIEGLGRLALGLVFAMVGSRLNLPLEILSSLTILGVTMGALFGLVYLFVCSKINISVEITEQNEINTTKRSILKRIFSISIPITLSAAVMSITNLIDLVLIMRSLVEKGYTDTMASSLYGNYTTLAVPMLNLATAVISPIALAYLPIFTRCCVSSDRSALIKTQRSAIELTAVFSAPMMVGLIVFAKEILNLLFPRSEISVGAPLLCLISPAILFSSLLLMVNTLLEAKGRVKAPLISMTVGSIAKIVVSYYLIAKTEIGILGAPVGTVISYAVGLIVSIIIYSNSFKCHIPLFSASLLPHLNAAISVMLSRIVFDGLKTNIDQRLSLIISIVLAALIYLIFSMITGVLSHRKMTELAKYTKLT